MIGLCDYCGTGFSSQEKRCSYCDAPIPETGVQATLCSHSSSPMQLIHRSTSTKTEALDLSESELHTCRRNVRGFLSKLFESSLLEYVRS